MDTCFVIQPFDGGRFDKRFDDVFVPAIEAAGLKPYRADRDPHVEIPIAQIEHGIRNAAVCLAEITLDNPNVWFEVGYALASHRSLVLVASKERVTKYPFDIQHRSIIGYTPESTSDFARLQADITSRLKALLQKQSTMSQVVASSSLANVEGLTPQELITLAAIAENLDQPQGRVSSHIVRVEVESSGFRKMAAMIGLQCLLQKGFVTVEESQDDYNNGTFTAYQITDMGWQWITAHQDKFSIHKPVVEQTGPPF